MARGCPRVSSSSRVHVDPIRPRLIARLRSAAPASASALLWTTAPPSSRTVPAGWIQSPRARTSRNRKPPRCARVRVTHLLPRQRQRRHAPALPHRQRQPVTRLQPGRRHPRPRQRRRIVHRPRQLPVEHHRLVGQLLDRHVVEPDHPAVPVAEQAVREDAGHRLLRNDHPFAQLPVVGAGLELQGVRVRRGAVGELQIQIQAVVAVWLAAHVLRLAGRGQVDRPRLALIQHHRRHRAARGLRRSAGETQRTPASTPALAVDLVALPERRPPVRLAGRAACKTGVEAPARRCRRGHRLEHAPGGHLARRGGRVARRRRQGGAPHRRHRDQDRDNEPRTHGWPQNDKSMKTQPVAARSESTLLLPPDPG